MIMWVAYVPGRWMDNEKDVKNTLGVLDESIIYCIFTMCGIIISDKFE
jgi:hypothetical protein